MCESVVDIQSATAEICEEKRIALSSEEDRATATVTCTEIYAKFGHVVSEIRQRTDRHTDTLIAILRTLSGTK